MLVQVNSWDWLRGGNHMFLLVLGGLTGVGGTYMETTRFTKPGSRRP